MKFTRRFILNFLCGCIDSRHRHSAIRAVVLFAAVMVGAATHTANAAWSLVWSDEFNGSGQPDGSKWNYHVGNGYNPDLAAFQGWGNGEWQWYRPEQCYQSGGNLVLKADYHTSPTTIAGRDWYQRSCRITTQGKHSWKYGRIEARLAAPNANGNWTAFWMLGDSCNASYTTSYNASISSYDRMATNWASCGEVDIFEHVNYDTTTFHNIFWDTRTGVYPWTSGYNANYGTTANVGNVANFNVYALEWDSTYIRWFVNGVQTHIIDIRPSTLEEFHKPFHLIFNQALGGQLTGQDPAREQFPLYMYVDYVRVYQAGSGSSSSSSSSSSGGATNNVAAGTYQLRNRASGKMLDNLGSTSNGANVAQWAAGSSNNQKYALSYSGGYAKLACLTGNMFVDSLGRTADGSTVGQWAGSSSQNQQWTIQDVGGGYYRIVNRANGKALDTGGATTDGAPMQFWYANSSHNQQWQFVAASGGSSSSSSSSGGGGTITYGHKIDKSNVNFYVNNSAWADVHYTINGGTQINVRMTKSGSNNVYTVSNVPKKATVRYFFTYANASGLAVDTAWVQFTTK